MLIIRLYTRFIVILLFVVFLTGCVNLKAVGKFSKGAQVLSEASGKFYAIELETDRQLAAMTVNLGAKQKSKKCKIKGDEYMTPWDCATKGKNLMAEVRRNRAAVATLAQYAKSLNEIATFDDDENIEKASQELSGNLSNLAKALDAANPKEEALASAISGLAKIYLDIKVRKIIYQKIKLAQDDVATIINTLRDDIKWQQQRLAINRLNAKATREEWFNAFRKGYQSGGASASDKAFLTIAAGKLVGDDLKDELAAQPATLFLEELNETAASCLKAHEAIQNPDLSDKAGTVIKFVNDARGLLSSVNKLSN
ncbi:MAG: hypothetical protein LWX54_08405 [Deltaproteobacteria bacterium]|jgi:hypothetical protein|nr:hypothetical protein [Deltaproteobacteria bacterium]